MTRAEKRQSQPGPGNFHDVEAAFGGYFRVGLGRCWALVGLWKRLPGWDAEQVLQKAENSLWAAGAWGGEMKCHSVHMGNLFSVAKGAPLACRQHRPEWPQGLAYSSDLAVGSSDFRLPLLESPLPGPPCLVLCQLEAGPLASPICLGEAAGF